jgi:quercetin dioxygenase-like cupin family protein
LKTRSQYLESTEEPVHTLLKTRVALVLWLVAVFVASLPVIAAQQPGGGGASQGQRESFTGRSDRLEPEGTISRRSFEPGARSYWHTHEKGQLVMVQEGRARVQSRGKAMRELGPGETDFAPPGVEHWHGATPTSRLVQLAVNFGGAIKWGDEVTDADYGGSKAR